MNYIEYKEQCFSGEIKGALQQMIPYYGIINSSKKAQALKKYGKEGGDDFGGHALKQLGANALGGIPGMYVGAKTSQRFEALVDELAEKYCKKHPDADYKKVRKNIKRAVYKNRPSKYIEN